VLQPDAVAEQVGVVVGAVDAEGDAEFSGTGGEILILHGPATGAHYLDPVHRLDRPDEDDMRMVGGTGYDVQLIVHSINKKNIHMPAECESRLGPGCASAAIAVGSSVLDAEICLCLHYHSGHAVSLFVRHNKQFAEQITGDRHRILTQVETSGDLHIAILANQVEQPICPGHASETMNLSGNIFFSAPNLMKLITFSLLLLYCVSAWAQTPDDVLATMTGRTITSRDLSPTAQQAIAKLPMVLADARKQLYSQKLGSILLEHEAKMRKTTVSALLKLQTAKIKDPTSAEIKAVYDANQEQIGGRPLAEVEKQIVAFIRRGPEEKAVSDLVDSLAAKYKVVYGKDVNAADLKPSDVLFTVAGKSITAKQFDDETKLTLYDIRADFHDEVMAEVEQALFDILVAEEAKALKLEPGELIAREITSKLKEYTDSERLAVQDAFVAKLFQKYNAKVVLPAPEPPVQNISTDDDPAIGPESAPVTVVMFSDFQCSACAAVYPILKHVMAGYGDKIRYVVRDFPLEGIHQHAFAAAKAASAAHAQGKFTEYTELLYSRQDALDPASLRKYAAELGLNVKQFELDFSDAKAAAEIRKDQADGRSYGISGTPAIFVNGVKVHRLSLHGFRSAIDRAMKK
jgi:protein-disulfide isomerase